MTEQPQITKVTESLLEKYPRLILTFPSLLFPENKTVLHPCILLLSRSNVYGCPNFSKSLQYSTVKPHVICFSKINPCHFQFCFPSSTIPNNCLIN